MQQQTEVHIASSSIVRSRLDHRVVSNQALSLLSANKVHRLTDSVSLQYDPVKDAFRICLTTKSQNRPMAVWQFTLWKLHALQFYSWQKCYVTVWLLGCWNLQMYVCFVTHSKKVRLVKSWLFTEQSFQDALDLHTCAPSQVSDDCPTSSLLL